MMVPGHAAHAHRVGADSDRRRLGLALGLMLAFLAAELAAAIVAHSLALLSDAAHMLTDAAGIALALLALALALRPPQGALTFGLRRAEILSAQINGVMLTIFAGFISYEGIRRLIDPPHVHAALVLSVALAGVLFNLAAARSLAGAARGNLNIEGSFQHVLTDLYGFIGTAIAAIVILASGFQRADPIASLVIALLMARSGWRLIVASGRVFLEAAPEALEPEEIGRALAAARDVVEVHDLHVWEIASGFPALSAHVLVAADEDCHAARRALEAMLAERFGLSHTTLQVDHAGERLLDIEPMRTQEQADAAPAPQ